MSELEQKPHREKIIHIIPLGFEIDRAVKPFEGTDGFRANRVHILSAIESDGTPEHFVERHRKYVEVVKNRLESFGIEVVIHNALLIDILEVMKKVSSIILSEKNDGNIVYLNMSAAGRLTSVGATLAAMVQGSRVYYVQANDYSSDKESMDKHGYSICDDVKILFIENFRISLPDDKCITVLVRLFDKGPMRTSELMEYLHNAEVDGFQEYSDYLSREEKIKYKMRLKRRILDKLTQSDYIEVHKTGRESIITITDSGKYIAGISGKIIPN